MATDAPPVEVRFVASRAERPPLVRLLFDIVLRNTSDGERWFVLPNTLRPPSEAEGGGVFAGEAEAPGGRGRVVICRFLGTGDFQVLLLPAGAEIKIRRFPMSIWSDPLDGPTPVRVIIARRITIAGEDAPDWIGIYPLCDREADVDAEERQMLGAKYTPDYHEVPAMIDEERRIDLQVTLKKGQAY
jgi:hypothetical protein